MAPTERLTLGLLGGLGDAIGGYPEAEPVPSTASPELPSGGGAITSMPAARRFSPPWTAEETDACFIVRDANGQALARDEASHLQCICKVGHSP
jgi:hypothetical protein